MALYKLFSCNVEIQYKNYFLSKAMLFTLITNLLMLILPFIIAHRSRGFWLRTQSFYEQPKLQSTYDYLLLAETDDPSQTILCGETSILSHEDMQREENCVKVQIQELDFNKDKKTDLLNFNFYLNIPQGRTISSINIILAFDFQLMGVCPLHMQSLGVIVKEFSVPPSGLIYYGDIMFHQTGHLPCLRHHIDTKYNNSLLYSHQDYNQNIVDSILHEYFRRDVTTQIKTSHSRNHNGHTGKIKLEVQLKVPEMLIHYTPNLLQELKWVWPQYLSLIFVFHWIFNKIKSALPTMISSLSTHVRTLVLKWSTLKSFGEIAKKVMEQKCSLVSKSGMLKINLNLIIFLSSLFSRCIHCAQGQLGPWFIKLIKQ